MYQRNKQDMDNGRNSIRAVRLRCALENRPVLDENAAGFLSRINICLCVRVAHQGFTILFVSCNVWEVDECQCKIRWAGDLRGQEISKQFSSTSADWLWPVACVPLEIRELVHVDCVTDAKCDHDLLRVGTIFFRAYVIFDAVLFSEMAPRFC